MPSRSRNRNTLEQRIIQAHRMFWYRFEIFLSDYHPRRMLPGGVWFNRIRDGESPESFTDYVKRNQNYHDINPWPVSFETWNQHINERLSIDQQKRKGLRL